MKKKGLTILLTLIMILPMFSVTAYSLEFIDMPNDWSTQTLENAVKNGLLIGDNGKIMPTEKLTRAQMATIVNRAFGAVKKSDLRNFSDVEKNAWYYDEMAKAVEMKTFLGDGSSLYPNNNITREEAFVVLARAFKMSGSSEEVLEKFSDSSSVSQWAKDGLASLVEAGYIVGSGGMLNPKQHITRAEFAQVMDNLLKNYIREKGLYTSDYEGNVMINVSDVTLKDLTINGDLIIGDGVGEGEITLDNVVITGKIITRDSNTVIIIVNSTSGSPTSSTGGSGEKPTTKKTVLVSKEQSGGMPTVEIKLRINNSYIDNFQLLFNDNLLAESKDGIIVVPSAVLYDLDRISIKYNNTIKEVDINTLVTSW